ncbi:MAG: hypothetical protein PVH87_23335 [Desulfobacteraceae bacterium]|jgi:hypothetical protein
MPKFVETVLDLLEPGKNLKPKSKGLKSNENRVQPVGSVSHAASQWVCELLNYLILFDGCSLPIHSYPWQSKSVSAAGLG